MALYIIRLHLAGFKPSYLYHIRIMHILRSLRVMGPEICDKNIYDVLTREDSPSPSPAREKVTRGPAETK